MMRFVFALATCLICSISFGQADAAKDKCRLGVEFYNQGELNKAIAEFTAAISLSPKDPFALKCRSFVWNEMNDLDKALADLNDAINLDAKDALTYFSRGNLWRKKGNLDRALADYNEAISINPERALPYVNRGTLLIENGDHEKALADYDKAIEIDPKLAAAYSGRAWIRATCPVAAIRNGPKAIADSTKANQLSEWNQADQLDTLAAAYAEVGKFDEAIKYQDKAIRLGTNNEWVKDFRSRLTLYQTGKPYRYEVKGQ